MWMLFSALSAFLQALGMALRKKVLQISGIRNFFASLILIVSGISLGLIFWVKTGTILPKGINTIKLWQGLFWLISLNVIAIYFQLKALEVAELSHIMPFMTLSVILIVIPPIFVFGEIPSIIGLLGIILIVAGAIAIQIVKHKNNITDIDAQEMKGKNNKRGLIYFLINVLCYALVPTPLKIVIMESSPLYAAFAEHFLTGLFFIPLVFVAGETEKIKNIFSSADIKKNFLIISLLLVVVSSVGDFFVNTALGMSKVAYVMAVRRTMPLFAFLMGYFYFKEKENAARKILATLLMVLGAVLIIIFG